MCWRSNDTVIKKVAERDFYVYKIGKIVWNNIFISDIRGYNYIVANIIGQIDKKRKQ